MALLDDLGGVLATLPGFNTLPEHSPTTTTGTLTLADLLKLLPGDGGSGSGPDHFFDTSPSLAYTKERDASQMAFDAKQADVTNSLNAAKFAHQQALDEAQMALAKGDMALAIQKQNDANHWQQVSAQLEGQRVAATREGNAMQLQGVMAQVEASRYASDQQFKVGMAGAANDAERNQIAAKWNQEQAAIAKMEDYTKRLLGGQQNQVAQFGAETARAAQMGNLALDQNKFLLEKSSTPRDLFGLYFLQRGITPDWDALQAGNVQQGQAMMPTNPMSAFTPTTAAPTFSGVPGNPLAGAVGAATGGGQVTTQPPPGQLLQGLSGGGRPAGNVFVVGDPPPGSSKPNKEVVFTSGPAYVVPESKIRGGLEDFMPHRALGGPVAPPPPLGMDQVLPAMTTAAPPTGVPAGPAPPPWYVTGQGMTTKQLGPELPYGSDNIVRQVRQQPPAGVTPWSIEPWLTRQPQPVQAPPQSAPTVMRYTPPPGSGSWGPPGGQVQGPSAPRSITDFLPHLAFGGLVDSRPGTTAVGMGTPGVTYDALGQASGGGSTEGWADYAPPRVEYPAWLMGGGPSGGQVQQGAQPPASSPIAEVPVTPAPVPVPAPVIPAAPVVPVTGGGGAPAGPVLDPVQQAYVNAGMGSTYLQSSANPHITNPELLPPKLKLMYDFGVPIPQQLLDSLTGGISAPLDIGKAFAARGIGQAPSLQTIARQTGGETDLLKGAVQGLGGISFTDFLDAIARPTQKLQSGQRSRAA